jgi:acyl carrier protein
MTTATRVMKVFDATLQWPRENEPITPDSTFHSLGMDSLDHVVLVGAIEEEFDLSMPEWASDDWTTVADVIASVEKAID